MRVCLVRHGQSQWNVAGRVQGQARGNHLTSVGFIQASQAAMLLGGCGASRVISSDLERAEETAHIVAQELGLPLELDAALREQAAGSLEGRLARDLKAQEPPEGLHLHDVRWGGGESVADVHARLRVWWEKLRRTPDQTVIVVSHGIALQVLRAVIAGRGAHDVVWDDALANGDVLVLDV